MNWEWAVSAGLITGDPTYYSSGQAGPEEVAHAIETAYLATEAGSPERKKLIDMLWSTGVYEGTKDYWYENRDAESASLAEAGKLITSTSRAATSGDTVAPIANLPDFTPDNDRGRFNVVGGNAEVWLRDDGTALIVYFVPGTDPPAPVYWEVPDMAVLQSYFGPDATVSYDREVTAAQLESYGALFGGSSTEIDPNDQDPLEGWATLFEEQSKVRPYLKDPQVLARMMAAAIEGRTMSKADFEGTDWWQHRTEGEREWAIMVEADPKTAAQLLDSNRQRIILDLQNAGVAEPSEDLIELMNTNFTTGAWTENQLVGQITAVSDPYSPFKLDPEVEAIVGGGVVGTQREQDTVRDMLQKWLGPMYGDWTQEQIDEKAGLLRNDPDGTINFEQQLKQQRLAMFPGYEDDNLSYEDIAQPWRNFWQQKWGVEADETDPLFQQVLNTNDAVENGAMLTKEGLSRGIQKVSNDIQSKILRATGGSVVR